MESHISIQIGVFDRNDLKERKKEENQSNYLYIFIQIFM